MKSIRDHGLIDIPHRTAHGWVMRTDCDVFPLGSYTNESWGNINKIWKKKKIQFPDGSIVICDGEPCLAEAFADQVEDLQRCHWHIGRDLYHSMWQDGATAKEVKPLRTALCGALAIELPEGNFKQVSETEKDKLEEKMERTEIKDYCSCKNK
ncbi:MAG: hypothetical protein L3J71_08585 [Victivallaceae bacterium]|nr:hypothetical protein [Victivallaceae bacterium]